MAKNKQMDTEELFKGLPEFRKGITTYFLKNRESIQQTMEKILNRKLNESEKYNLREYAMELAIIQVADDYYDNLEDSNE